MCRDVKLNVPSMSLGPFLDNTVLTPRSQHALADKSCEYCIKTGVLGGAYTENRDYFNVWKC